MKIYTAPLAGITDYSFRKILEKFSPDLIFTEMINARLFSEGDKDTLELLKCDNRNITGVQVFGSREEDITNSFLKLEDMGFNRINLNMGCPQPKIIKTGAGCGLLPRREFIDNLLYNLKSKLKNTTKISIKIRIGYKEFHNPEIYLDLANKYNLDFICVHGRNQEQMYNGIANWDILKGLSHIKRNIDFIGNGDLIQAKNIPDIIEGANIDGIMLARGIIGNPYLIPQTREILSEGDIKTKPSFEEVKSTLLEHFNLLSEHKGEIAASMEINKFIKPYFWNLKSHSLMAKLTEIIIEKDAEKKMKEITGL